MKAGYGGSSLYSSRLLDLHGFLNFLSAAMIRAMIWLTGLPIGTSDFSSVLSAIACITFTFNFSLSSSSQPKMLSHGTHTKTSTWRRAVWEIEPVFWLDPYRFFLMEYGVCSFRAACRWSGLTLLSSAMIIVPTFVLVLPLTDIGHSDQLGRFRVCRAEIFRHLMSRRKEKKVSVYGFKWSMIRV